MLRNFFRKKQKPKIELEKVNFNEIEDWLENKKNKLIKKEEEIFIIIKKRANISTSNISGKIKNLEAIDIESKKVEERAKIIVRQSLDKYLSFVEVFTKELTETKRERLSNFIEDTNQIFSDFDKRSYIFYQRANYLIGDELVVDDLWVPAQLSRVDRGRRDEQGGNHKRRKNCDVFESGFHG